MSAPPSFVARDLPCGVCQIHRAGCATVTGKHAPGLLLGDGLTAEQLRAELVRRGDYREQTRFCRVCLPELEPLPKWQEHVLDHHFVSKEHARLLGYPIGGTA